MYVAGTDATLWHGLNHNKIICLIIDKLISLILGWLHRYWSN